MLKLTRLLNEHLEDVHDTQKLYEVGREYDRLGQCSAAIPFYLRACDKEWEDTLLQYKSLLRMVIMYHRLGNRLHTVEGIIQNAVTIMPERPEGWYWFARLMKENSNWKRCLMYASVGLRCEEPEDDIDVEYPGHFALAFYESIGDWYVRGIEESKEKTFGYKYWWSGLRAPTYEKEFDMLIKHHSYPSRIPYNEDLYPRWKYDFPGLETIKKNYSRRFQDMVVLTLLDGKRNGTYLQLGCDYAEMMNNTYLLEKEFGWKGFTFDQKSRILIEHKKKRENPIMCIDPLNINYEDFFHQNGYTEIDYLQIENDYNAINLIKSKIPFDKCRFKVISLYMTDINAQEIKDYRNRLRQAGYKLLFGDIYSSPHRNPNNKWFEDIWVHLPSIDAELHNAIVDNNSSFIVDGLFYHEQ